MEELNQKKNVKRNVKVAKNGLFYEKMNFVR